MRLLLFSLTAFWPTIAHPAANDGDDLVFPTGTQAFSGDFSWNDPDVDLGFATGDLGLEVANNHNADLFNEGSNSEYLSFDDFFTPTTPGDEQPSFGLDSVCLLSEGSAVGKVRRENQCPGPIAPSPDTENQPGSTEESGSNTPEPESEPQPLSTSLLGVSFEDLCPPSKVPGRVPLCCEGRPYRYFVSNCINYIFYLPECRSTLSVFCCRPTHSIDIIPLGLQGQDCTYVFGEPIPS